MWRGVHTVTGVRLVDSRQGCAKLLSGDEETLGKHLFWGTETRAKLFRLKQLEACSNKNSFSDILQWLVSAQFPLGLHA